MNKKFLDLNKNKFSLNILFQHMPNLVNHLHYRIVDVSTIKEL
jgi:oligoribonuclease (3'-5' exoribonuclease)